MRAGVGTCPGRAFGRVLERAAVARVPRFGAGFCEGECRVFVSFGSPSCAGLVGAKGGAPRCPKAAETLRKRGSNDAGTMAKTLPKGWLANPPPRKTLAKLWKNAGGAGGRLFGLVLRPGGPPSPGGWAAGAMGDREWKKPRGAGSGGGGFPDHRQLEAGIPAPEDVLQAALQDRQPDLKEQVGAAPASAHRLLFGHAPADDPVDHRFNGRRGDALA